MTSPARLTYATKEQVIYDYLRDAIIGGELKPGSRLILRQIAEDAGASEIPVREAIKRLEAEGLVETRPHVGATVTALHRDDLLELFDVRVVNEALAARLAATRITREEINALRGLVKQMDRCTERDDAAEYGRLNREFNRILSEASGNRHLIAIIRRLQALTDRSRALFVWDPQRLRSSNLEHARIVDLLVQREADAVEALVRNHRRAGFDAFIAALDRVTREQAAE
jgi:DNA-binding GntR family transcriptional regulator